jgi:hypothetical protein
MLKEQEGVSLIITSFIMIIILAVVFSISGLLYSEIKVIRNIGSSVMSFFVADSGIEKVLFYDRQALPALEDALGNPLPAVRGLCTMYDYSNYSNTCPKNNSDVAGLDSSMYCQPDMSVNSGLPKPGSSNPIHGCDPDACDDCNISFITQLDNGGVYKITASVYPSASGQATDFGISSLGAFNSTSRMIQVETRAVESTGAIIIQNACANPKSTAQGYAIDISAKISVLSSSNSIRDYPTATIKDASGNIIASNQPLSLASGNHQTGTWSLHWLSGSSASKTYYVDVDAYDTIGSTPATSNHVTCRNIYPYPLCMGTNCTE